MSGGPRGGVGALGAACAVFVAACAAARPARPPVVAPPVFVEACASCHGDKGRGDGPAGRFLNPPPRDFGDEEWQASITDDRLRQTIRQGGAAMGLSPAMAPHPDLSSDQVEELIRYIRSIPTA
jgi:mono/diheme cytochrome c family protein